ncbi:MAG: hypothetical protein GXO82_02895 [Chlorobi bacterium]|nr:hypothetical protein [Chlorobiota bacterium]
MKQQRHITRLLVVAALGFAFFTSSGLAQEREVAGDQGGKKADKQKVEMKKPQVKNEKRMELKGFIDENGDGIDDRMERGKMERNGEHGREHHRMRDHFIDMDGDGINDNRCDGMGIGNKQRSRSGRHMR